MRKLPILLLAVIIFSVVLPAHAIDPGEAFAKARTHIASKQYREALALLGPALEGAAAIQDPAARRQAESAIHFYTAVAHSGLSQTAEARKHLQAYLAVNPEAKRVDPAKYDQAFVKLFDEITGHHSAPSNPDRFDTYYPSFTSYAAPAEATRQEGTWGDSPAIEILGSKSEQSEWRDLIAPAAREKFITDFWQKRDQTPGTPENEFRNEFVRRVAFADLAFKNEGVRGAVTDRGKVFVLLGEPAKTLRRAIMATDRIQASYPGAIINGTIEEWVYVKAQLPMRLAKNQVKYRFVTQQGIGEHVLQRQEDAFAMQALALAGNPAAAH